MRIIRKRCLGLDLHKKQITGHLRVHRSSNEEPERMDIRFGTMPDELLRMRDWIVEHSGAHPALVAVDGDGTVMGFGSLTPYRPRPARGSPWPSPPLAGPDLTPPTAVTRSPAAGHGGPGCPGPSRPRAAHPGNTVAARDVGRRRTSGPPTPAGRRPCPPSTAARGRPCPAPWPASGSARRPARGPPPAAPAAAAAAAGDARSPPSPGHAAPASPCRSPRPSG